MSSAISVEGVSKAFRIYHERNQSLKAALLRGRRSKFEEYWALRDITLDVVEGQTFGLMGHNGSGKSTLLKCMARILEPNSGRIRTRGRVAAMLELGSGFHPDLSGRENVHLNGSILGMSRRELERKFEEIVDFAGVGNFIDQPVKTYSSGMYVRLGFSVAIHVQPDILLVDEILAVGDMQFQDRCKEKFAEFKADGRTVVVVSHGLGEMRTFCDQAAWLDHGKLIDQGPASAIVDRYIEAGHHARPVENGGHRYGSGEIEISSVDVLDRFGNDVRELRTGDAVTFRLHWRTNGGPVERPVFGVSFKSLDGVHVWSHNTWDADYIPQRLNGSGTIEIEVPNLPLQPGIFDLNTSAVNDTFTHDFDQWVGAARLDIVVGTPRESGGLVVMRSQWGGLSAPATITQGRGALGRLAEDRQESSL